MSSRLIESDSREVRSQVSLQAFRHTSLLLRRREYLKNNNIDIFIHDKYRVKI